MINNDLDYRGSNQWEESMAAVSQEQQPTPERFFNTVNAYQQTEAMKAAIGLETFAAISEGCTTAAAIASRCQAASAACASCAIS